MTTVLHDYMMVTCKLDINKAFTRFLAAENSFSSFLLIEDRDMI